MMLNRSLAFGGRAVLRRMAAPRHVVCSTVLCGTVLYGTLVCGAAAAASSDVADAAMRKNRDAVRTLIQQKADVNAPQADGTRALHWAARWDDVALAEALL